MEQPNALLRRIEEAHLWGYFHKDWLLSIRSLLRPQLPDAYHLFVESEAILISPGEARVPRAMLPDVAVTRRGAGTNARTSRPPAKGTAALVEVEEPCEIDTQYSLVIRRSPDNRLVAAPEILSPSNKGLGNRFDRDKHLRKRDSFLDAGVQLMEIDALVQGQRQLPAGLMDTLAPFSRIAWTVTHLDGRRIYRGWGWNDHDPLPALPWPIEGDIEAYVDLAESVSHALAFNSWNELVAGGGAGDAR